MKNVDLKKVCSENILNYALSINIMSFLSWDCPVNPGRTKLGQWKYDLLLTAFTKTKNKCDSLL